MRKLLIGGLTASLILATPAFGARKNTQRVRAVGEGEITIQIRDYAQANPSVLRHAEQVAGDILQKAGVATRWIDCPVGSSRGVACSSPVSTLDFFVNLLPESMSDRLRLPGGVLGSAIEGSGRDFGFMASVFYDVAKDRAAAGQVDFGELLGDAIAHELGHLLLGTNSHSGWSLMSAFWSGNQFRLVAQGLLAFSDVEAKRIHAAIHARTLAATASTEATELSRVASTDEQFSARGNHK
ncbi:MAG: hypothetical protein WAM79_07265 [Candidatus Sulfotelmatobacter sp.]